MILLSEGCISVTSPSRTPRECDLKVGGMNSQCFTHTECAFGQGGWNGLAEGRYAVAFSAFFQDFEIRKPWQGRVKIKNGAPFLRGISPSSYFSSHLGDTSSQPQATRPRNMYPARPQQAQYYAPQRIFYYPATVSQQAAVGQQMYAQAMATPAAQQYQYQYAQPTQGAGYVSTTMAPVSSSEYNNRRGMGFSSKKLLPWKTITINFVPVTVEHFIQIRNSLSTTPSGAFAVMLLAMHLYTVDTTLGTKCLIIAMHRSILRSTKNLQPRQSARLVTFKGMRPFGQHWDDLKKRLARYPYIPRSFFVGCKPENSYALPHAPLVVRVKDCAAMAQANSNNATCHAMSNGAMSNPPIPRGMILGRNTRGIWKVSNWESILAPCRAPPVTDDGDDL